ncbi:hypothetical protein TNCV_310851 [Trichonephila clavipes]|nr:hypothetical protein TNCV_310851 [Trichonephila clavipes]
MSTDKSFCSARRLFSTFFSGFCDTQKRTMLGKEYTITGEWELFLFNLGFSFEKQIQAIFHFREATGGLREGGDNSEKGLIPLLAILTFVLWLCRTVDEEE